MTSAIDPTVPAANSALASAPVRNNFAHAASEISALQSAIAPPNSALLGGNGTALVPVAVGTGLSLTSGTLNATGTTFTVPNAPLVSGNGTALGSMALGTNLTVSGTFPNQTLNATGGTGTGNVTTTTLTTSQLTVGTGAQAIGSFAPGAANTLLHSGTPPTWSAVSLTTDVTGILPVANGGTGSATTGSGVTSVSFNVPAASIYTATGGTVTGTGTLGFSLTGTSGGIPYFSTAAAMSTSGLLFQRGVVLGGGAGAAPYSINTLGTSGYVLTSNGAAADPTWQVAPGAAGGVGTGVVNQLALYNTTTSVIGDTHISETGTGTKINYNTAASDAAFPGFTITPALRITYLDPGPVLVSALAFGNAAGQMGHFMAANSGGTGTAPAATPSGNTLGSYSFGGWDGTNNITISARFGGFATETFGTGTPNRHGARAEIATTPTGGATLTAVMGFEANGGITVPPSVTGGGIGSGIINAQGYYLNGNPFTAGGADTVTGAITAHAGGGQASATALPSQFNVVTVVATAGDSVVLPAGTAGAHCLVRNSGAVALAVFPASGAQINIGGANNAITVAANTTAYFECQSATQWFTVP